MSETIEFVAAVPVLASLDIRRSVDFFADRLGCTVVYAAQGEYGIVSHGAVEIHFWGCSDAAIPAATGCRVGVVNIAALYDQCVREKIVHPNGALHVTPWGKREFAILDPDHNLVTFFEPVASSA